MRVLVLSNMRPDFRRPERGRFVRDQVNALRRLPDLDVELHEFPPGGPALLAAARALRRSRPREPFDVVHAHFGLTAYPALAVPARLRGLTLHGTDLRHPRTRLATRAILDLLDLLAVPSAELLRELPGGAARRRALLLPCGVDLERFRPLDRAHARAELGLHPERPCLLFPADPARPGKRHDRALALARLDTGAGSSPDEVTLLTLGGVEPERVPLLVNAANAVLVPSEHEGFGLAVLEALACDVPVLATPVGVHPEALHDLPGTLCAPFDLDLWRAALQPHLRDHDPRIQGRARAEPYSAQRTAERLAGAWSALLHPGRVA
ncbi:MAG TPA: glycosyltransferase [Solirubrobacteraceae bacterium]|nr:glycosyltransferase [Solirubrobacteraceae bacterium]